MTALDTSRTAPDRVPGQFTLVLHSHLPWLANHGRWPVGEEWLYQSWAASYLPLLSLLREFAAAGRTDQFSLGITPVLMAQLDDPHCLLGMHEWLANWQLRAHEAALSPDADMRAHGHREYRSATAALTEFEQHWRHGGSAALRPLLDAGVAEFLGGPLAHPFTPLLEPRLRTYSLREGLRDSVHRMGIAPSGIWAPECAFDPGMQNEYAAAGVSHFMVDGPTLHGDTALGRPVDGTDVVAFGRDLTVSYRVWSPRSGYPGHNAYRDFHAHDHEFGLKHRRVTGKQVAAADKRPYDPALVPPAIARHVTDFVACVRRRLISETQRQGRPALVVAAFDTELFGHWWYEGPQWLRAVLAELPRAGITVGSLATARNAGFVGTPVELGPSSWGAGKDWRVWCGDAVADIVTLNREVTDTALATIDKRLAGRHTRDRVSDQILREALLTVSSDWAFLISHDGATQYARDRAHLHAHATREICAAADSGNETRAAELAHRWSLADNLFAALDARGIDGGSTF